MSHTTYLTSAEILAHAHVSDSPGIMQFDQLDPDTKLSIFTARLHGYQSISVRWPGGQFALMLCEPGTNMALPAPPYGHHPEKPSTAPTEPGIPGC